MHDSRLSPGRGRIVDDPAFVMEAPLQRELRQRLAGARTLRDWGIVRAQQALYLARTRDIDEAARIPAEIRARFAGQELADVYCWLWIAEGVLDYYRSASDGAAGLLQRAHAVARSIGDEALQQLAGAWLANACLRGARHDEMLQWLQVSGLHRAKLPEAAARACIVAAVAWQTACEDRHAARWFDRARDAARAIGDRASIMASIENRALVRLDRLWLDWCRGRDGTYTVADIESELLGALQYERLTASEAFLPLGDVARIRLHVLRGRLSDALAGSQALPGQGVDGPFSTLRSVGVLHRWLQAELGVRPSGSPFTLEEARRLTDGLEPDDAASGWALAARLLRRRGDEPAAAEAQALSDAAWDRHAAQTERLLAGLRACDNLAD